MSDPEHTQLNNCAIGHSSAVTLMWNSANTALCKEYKKGKVFYGHEPPSEKYTTTEYAVNYQLLAVMLMKYPKWELPGAVGHSKLRTIASETWFNWLAVTPHPTQGSTPWGPRIARCICGLQITRLTAQVRREHVTLGMPGQRTACAATPGIKRTKFDFLPMFQEKKIL